MAKRKKMSGVDEAGDISVSDSEAFPDLPEIKKAGSYRKQTLTEITQKVYGRDDKKRRG